MIPVQILADWVASSRLPCSTKEYYSLMVWRQIQNDQKPQKPVARHLHMVQRYVSAGSKELQRGSPHKKFLNNPYNFPKKKVSLNYLLHNYIYLALAKSASQISTILCPPLPLALLPGGGKLHTAEVPHRFSFSHCPSISPNLGCRVAEQ